MLAHLYPLKAHILKIYLGGQILYGSVDPSKKRRRIKMYFKLCLVSHTIHRVAAQAVIFHVQYRVLCAIIVHTEASSNLVLLSFVEF